MEVLEAVDKRILDLMKDGKSTMEIATILNKEGFKTAKGDLFLRKSVNNRQTHLKSKGINLATGEKQNKISKMIMVEPHIYQANNGRFRVRKSVNGNLLCKTFIEIQAARDFVKELESSHTDKALVKVQPKVSRVVNIPSFNEDTDVFTVMTFKGPGAKDMALKFWNNN